MSTDPASVVRVETPSPEDAGVETLRLWVRDGVVPTPEVAARTATIHREFRARSRHVGRGDFTELSAGDLRLLHDLYDARFFGGAVAAALGGAASGRLGFRLSSRMTSAGGKTYCYPRGRRGGAGPVPHFEIAVSTHLLFGNFAGAAALVSGLPCRDRLEGLQRVFEHELVHLLEYLVHGSSNCRKRAFRDLAGRLFGHREVTHQMLTTAQRVRQDRGLRVGDRVAFRYRGRRLEGRLNRVTKRATVLVEHAAGASYSDGRSYLKFYVPVEQLEKAEA